MTTEYLENDADTFADTQAAVAPDDSVQTAAETFHEAEVAAAADEASQAGDAPQAPAADEQHAPAEDHALTEAEALFAEIDANASGETETDDAHSDLDAVPVALSFELGNVALPLSEVRTLGPGGVVLFSGGSPASIAIVSAGQTLGRGELVDVEGRLGIRVTQWRTPC